MQRLLAILAIPVRRFLHLSRRMQVMNGCILAVGLVACFGFILAPASTNKLDINDVAVAADKSQQIGPNDLRPEACRDVAHDITVTRLISGGEPIVGSSDSELILSDDNTVNIDGGDGDDCIVAGTNTTYIDGGTGTNVCVVPATVLDVMNCTRVEPGI